MKISQLIARLNRALKENGDLEVLVEDQNDIITNMYDSYPTMVSSILEDGDDVYKITENVETSEHDEPLGPYLILRAATEFEVSEDDPDDDN